MGRSATERLLGICRRLEAAYDIEGWHWRDDTGWLEICLGAILVQHTAWANVERALVQLRHAGAFSLQAISVLPEAELAELVRPAGMPLQKAGRLKRFAALVERLSGPPPKADPPAAEERFLSLPVEELRAVLLATPGIGKETADAIVLYAARRPVFVIDAYTVRLFRRLGLGPGGDGYETWQRWFEERLRHDTDLYRRYHAAIVLHCKNTCRARPRCQECVLLDTCPTGEENVRTAVPKN